MHLFVSVNSNNHAEQKSAERKQSISCRGGCGTRWTMADADEPIGNLMEKKVREKSGRRMNVQRMRSGQVLMHLSI